MGQATRRALFSAAFMLPAVVAIPALAPAATPDIEIHEAVRAHWWSLAESKGISEEETERFATLADAADDLVRAAPCNSNRAAILKLRSVATDLNWGARNNTTVDPAEVVAQVIAFLEAN